MLETLFGSGKDLNALQMGMRAWVVFLIALVLVRIAGMRAFGRKSSFDTVVAFMLGAVLSRAIVGASPFVPTVVGALVMVLLHRVVAIATAVAPSLERLVKGRPKVVYHEGSTNEPAMKRSGISRGDLDEAVRSRAQRPNKSEVSQIWLESSGDLTVIEK